MADFRLGACPPNPTFVSTTTVTMLSVDTGPLPGPAALPCVSPCAPEPSRQRHRRQRP